MFVCAVKLSILRIGVVAGRELGIVVAFDCPGRRGVGVGGQPTGQAAR